MRKNSPAFVTLVLGAVLMTGACGSDESTGSSSAGVCQSACARCGGDLCVDCSSVSERYRSDYQTALYSCVNGADGCSAATWGTCSVQASTKAPRRPADDTYRGACMTKRTECASQNVNFADDYCLQSSLFSEAWLQKANDCIAKSCADVSTCLRDVFK